MPTRQRKTEQAALCEIAREAIRQHAMLEPGSRVLAAVSGGPDSVALLDVLVTLGYEVEVAHLDHGTRDGASREDAVFVRKLAAEAGLPFHLETRDVPAEVARFGASFEQYARDVRYAFLTRIAQARKCDAIATGHHAGDQAETVMMRLLRGCGPDGLSGIPPVRLIEHVRLVRPLLYARREAILAHLQTRGLTCRTDASNADPTFLRNRLRNELLPLIEREYAPTFQESLARLAEIQRVQQEFMSGHVDAAFAACANGAGQILDRAAYRALSAALRHGVLLRFADSLGVALTQERVARADAFVLDAPTGRRFDFGAGVSLYSAREHIQAELPNAMPPAEPVMLDVPGTVRAFGRVFHVHVHRRRPAADLRRYCTPTRQVFDGDVIGPILCVRARKEGDRFIPFGMTSAKKLKAFLIDRGVPEPERDSLPLIADLRTVLWVVGLAPSACGAVTAKTRLFVEIEVTSLETGRTE